MNPSGVGLDGRPRLLDGDLDAAMVADVGATEFGWVDLSVSGDLVAGGELAISLEGPEFMVGWLWAGSEGAEQVVDPFGLFFIDLTAPRRLLRLGALPKNLFLHIPIGVPPGTTIALQGLGVDPTNSTGNLSPPVVRVID